MEYCLISEQLFQDFPHIYKTELKILTDVKGRLAWLGFIEY